ncbi:MAG: proton-conducting transporter membrane subunit [Eubacteriales bacterium]
MELYVMIILPILASLLLYVMPGKITTILSTFVYVVVFGCSVVLFYQARFLGEIITTKTDVDFLGITLYCDLYASVFLVLVSFLFLCMFLFTTGRERTDKLFAFLFAVLQSLVMLIFLSRDLFNIYVAIEVSSIVCGILIMFKRESRSIYDGLVYLLVNMLGMLFFLLGIGMVYRQFGILDFDSLIQVIGTRDPSELVLAYSCLMTGVLLKCAIFPMHFWLPLAHGTPGAPTAVSAILSGIYVKSGVYLFMRLEEIFSVSIDLSSFFFWIGVISSLAGIIMAICQSDIKLILAYHTVSQIGLIIAGLSAPNEKVQAGAFLHIINHAMFKSLLFLAAGMLISRYGTRNIYKIRGVMRSMPLAGIAIVAGILGITGAPFFNGSISKYFLAQTDTMISTIFFTIINFGTILSFVKFGKVLFGEKQDVHFKYDFFSTAVIITLSGLCLLTGVFAEPMVQLVLGMELKIGISGYMNKIIIWAVSFILAELVYKYIISKSKRIKSGIDFTISFNGIALCLCSSFVILTVIMMYWVCWV